jgi:hypothetical protein
MLLVRHDWRAALSSARARASRGDSRDSIRSRSTMKKLFSMLAVAALASSLGLVALAADEKTITGEGQCAKCSLKETPKCQNAIVAEEDGKKVTYYLAENAVSKAFHKNVCQEVKKVKATGTVKETDGKQVLTASKIEVVKD